MRIRIWNAFASNNSGSYLIVGRFPTEALAAEAAAELLAMAQQQSVWAKEPSGESPLAQLATRHGFTYVDEDYGGDWPQYSNKPHPDVWSVGTQVFIYADYTATMPRALGHYMYARGGRVETELNHTHHPIYGLFEIWFPWQTKKDIDVPARIQDIIDALHAPGGVFATDLRGLVRPAWRAGDGAFGEPDLVIGAAFDDLAAGFAGIAAAARAAGAGTRVNVFEARAGDPDPIAYLRPSSPATSHALTDVWLDAIGDAPLSVVKVVAEVRHLGHAAARAYVDRAPIVIAEALAHAQAEALAARLRVGNAVVTLRPTT